MNLSQLLAPLPDARRIGSSEPDIAGLSYDSRKVDAGHAFFAVPGEVADGRRFCEAAIKLGAVAIVAESPPVTDLERSVVWWVVPSVRIAMAEAASLFYQQPSYEMKVAGVTGTNGKTTTAFLIHHLISHSAGRCGLFGTIKYDTGRGGVSAERTTPEAIDLQRLMDEARGYECPAVVMEVSSHALMQQRVRAVKFSAAVFTNLSQDHLDYHGNMEDYFTAKRALFNQTAAMKGSAVINIDDTFGKRLAAMLEDKLEVVTFGLSAAAGFRASNARTTKTGTTYQFHAGERSFLVEMPLFGAFNVSNSLAALATVSILGFNLREAVNALRDAPQVPGRLELVQERRPFRVFVDYAHTPDALTNVLKTVRLMSPRRVITVFGCGGDRDREKRPLMARAVGALSDVCVVTSDNPRSEDPERIIADVKAGLTGSHIAIVDRREAINTAINLADEGDIVLIAGKGHEAYQEFATETLPFDDRRVAASAMREWSNNRTGGDI
ncbi:MAG: UDP-N-acetylmuramoyl-L-alanyl-D-glutamate--2,6-diaminopimelate ligase [Verrucomicrobiae bacterium]|nr:UDP-N-acetylmuramoyl-L-alanyl-D-glutamate--2,6-diaminopimelate ligase [Verrucomicrobiae bacterium]